MKPLLLATSVAFFFTTLHAQINHWTWIKGDSSLNKLGVYGIFGTSSATNKPGARNRSNSWTDAAGKFWMFGGTGCGAANSGYLNDLWQYDPSTNNWTWVNGDNIPNKKSCYGVQNITNTANKPGARKNSVTWADKIGNLWLFGGYGYSSTGQAGILNDLWKYEIASNKWTWVKGDSVSNVSGLYNAQGTASINKKPGARHLSHGWTDTQGNLWLFGGFGYDVNGDAGNLNDLWKYNIYDGTWIWIKGDTIRNVKSNYGVKGKYAAPCKPGARASSVTWTANDILWMYGGFGYDAANPGYLGDLWKYNIPTNEWMWVNGDNAMNIRPSYGTKGIASTLNNPGARDFSVGSTDELGNLVLFGGYGYAGNGFGYLNDMWKYNAQTNEWTWLHGSSNDNATANYGSFGTPSPANKPGSRNQGICWADEQGKFWMFGGMGYTANANGYLNDMWVYGQLQLLPVQLINFSGQLERSGAKLTWKIENEQNLDKYEVEKSTDGKDFVVAGIVEASNLRSYTLIDKFLSNTPVANERAQNLLYYRLKMIDKDGKHTYSKVIVLKVISTNSFTIYPNPATINCQLLLEKKLSGKIFVTIIDATGKALHQKIYETYTSTLPLLITGISPGIYTVLLSCENGNFSQQLVIVP